MSILEEYGAFKEIIPPNRSLSLSLTHARTQTRTYTHTHTHTHTHTFFREDHEIFSAVILFLPLIQEGQLSFSGERMCIVLVNRLED